MKEEKIVIKINEAMKDLIPSLARELREKGENDILEYAPELVERCKFKYLPALLHEFKEVKKIPLDSVKKIVWNLDQRDVSEDQIKKLVFPFVSNLALNEEETLEYTRNILEDNSDILGDKIFNFLKKDIEFKERRPVFEGGKRVIKYRVLEFV